MRISHCPDMACIASVGERLTIVVLSLDASIAQGNLKLNLLGSVVEFERETMLEAQREGIAKAKAAGKYKGRKLNALAKSDEVLALAGDGIGATKVAQDLSISRASVCRILHADQS